MLVGTGERARFPLLSRSRSNEGDFEGYLPFLLVLREAERFWVCCIAIGFPIRCYYGCLGNEFDGGPTEFLLEELPEL